MTGRILGYDANDKSGAISGDNASRYKFSIEDWKDTAQPQKDMKVDFDTDDSGNAKDIYLLKDHIAENTSTLLGLVAVAITFFFGFIGTFVSRLFIAKHDLASVIVPTIIHFLITVLFLIPVFGWFIYVIGTLYYMYKNYQLVMQARS